MLGRDVAVEVVVPKAVIERQALDRPLILEVDSQIPIAVLPEIRRRILRDLIRDAVVEPVIHVAVRFRAEILDRLLELEPCLEVMGPGDVGQGKALGEAGNVLDRVVGQGRVVGHPGRLLRDGNVIRRDARLRLGGPALPRAPRPRLRAAACSSAANSR